MKYASLATSQLTPWALLNNVELRGIKVETDILDADGNSKGGGIVATSDHSKVEPLLIVPRDITVSKSSIADCARTDYKLRQLLEALAGSDLIQTTRGLFMVFLLYQFTVASADIELDGVQSSFTDYVKFLPHNIPLPTFYTETEILLLEGTSLSDALAQKLSSLQKDFELLGRWTKGLGWARKSWWGLEVQDEDSDSDAGESSAPVRFDDWKLMDAIYRSRALELPDDKGVVMVPVLDMANHASDRQYNARFEADGDENIMLLSRDGKHIHSGEEINIMYGCGGACEMIFSYGFLDPGATSAREMFLNLSVPLDDPLRLAKMRFADAAPGMRFYVDEKGVIGWESDFVWWACVNEEDGLDFQVLQSNNGQKELKAIWKGCEFQPDELKSILMEDELRDIFVLRSLVLMQQRVEKQGTKIGDSEPTMQQARDMTGVRHATWQTINNLRELELELLALAYEKLEVERAAMLNSAAIGRYFSGGNNPSDRRGRDEIEQDDFS